MSLPHSALALLHRRYPDAPHCICWRLRRRRNKNRSCRRPVHAMPMTGGQPSTARQPSEGASDPTRHPTMHRSSCSAKASPRRAAVGGTGTAFGARPTLPECRPPRVSVIGQGCRSRRGLSGELADWDGVASPRNEQRLLTTGVRRWQLVRSVGHRRTHRLPVTPLERSVLGDLAGHEPVERGHGDTADADLGERDNRPASWATRTAFSRSLTWIFR